MKKYLQAVVLVFLFASTGMSQFNFGAGAQILFDGSVFGIQGKALYTVDESWRGAGSFTIHLKELVDWSIDVDVHYTALEISENFNLAPFAGLGMTRFGILGLSSTEIGINLGAFFELAASESIDVYIEPKLNVGGYESFGISGGILF